ncbi:MAG: nitroreductase family protein, partial [Lachnospiraceae bacterium]|nr:nitroreductase family protein [Lachnospiraceae bacterium]
MDYFDLTKIRVSTRKFTDEQITDDQLAAILEAGERAPIGSSRYANLRLTVVQNKDVLHQLSEAARIRHTDLAEMAEIIANVSNRNELLDAARDFDPFYGAPTVIFVSHRKQDLEPGIEFANVSCVV